MNNLSKRLIEVDLPIRRISEHARREKSIRHGHISTLHIWWARRPLAACRAVLCASLWPDPADPNCSQVFVAKAKDEMLSWTTHERLSKLSVESHDRFNKARKDASLFDDLVDLRMALLDFIADFANWDNSTDAEYLATSRVLTQCAHEALGGIPGTHPTVVDPFAGGGAIPLEALRVGGVAYASDLNPVATALNILMLEMIPKYDGDLEKDLVSAGITVGNLCESYLKSVYPYRKGHRVIGYLWARTIRCEGPGCGVEIPLLGNMWLSKQKHNKTSLNVWCDKESNKVKITHERDPFKVQPGLTSGNSATCPCCGYTTQVAGVRAQLKKRKGGTKDSLLVSVIETRVGQSGKLFRQPEKEDFEALEKTQELLKELDAYIPLKDTPPIGALGYRFQNYGITKWRDLYLDRQLLVLAKFSDVIGSDSLRKKLSDEYGATNCLILQGILSFAIGRLNDRLSSICRWRPDKNNVEAANGGQNKMPMLLDFAESTPFGGSSGDWYDHIEWMARVVSHIKRSKLGIGYVQQSAAQEQWLPDASIDAFITDPPYYDAFGYGDLSEFFHIWMRNSLPFQISDRISNNVPKEKEAIAIGKALQDNRGLKDEITYENDMHQSFLSGLAITKPQGIGVVVFANKSTKGWESILNALVKAGWKVTASWPIDTELANRQRAIGSAALNSSIHIVVRPRIPTENNCVGDWRDVLEELPKRIKAWLPHLAEEGVVGADAIFACLGPALEIFSRYDSVEKASGEVVALREYLEHVWAAVSREALSSIVADADLSGFESDARLSAMWLWTVAAARNGKNGQGEEDKGNLMPAGFTLEYDAARKIAQGLGANLDDLKSIVEVKGDKATLLPVAQRTEYLFGKSETEPRSTRGRNKKSKQLNMFAELVEEGATEDIWEEKTVSKPGETVLDRVHQAMILFASGRGDALKRFLVGDGVGQEPGLWKLAQAFSALYPAGTQEKRWVDGVLARKKGLGL